jgi:hypothetical protein
MAAHALRELDSMLRSVLAVPMEAIAVAVTNLRDKLKHARKGLRRLKKFHQILPCGNSAGARRLKGVLVNMAGCPDSDYA